jgi:hypothetical protein
MAKKKRRSEIRNVPLEDIKQGPIRQKKGLTPVLEGLARAIFATVGHFVYPTFEQWELGFMRDMHPWREISIWENIARTFDLYVAEHPEAANSGEIVGTIVSISTGQVFEKETGTDKELRKLFAEAAKKQWAAPPGEPFEFPENQALVLQYEDIVDQWNGAICPNLRRAADPRRILAAADIILGMASKSEECFCIYGRDHLEDGGIPEGFKTLVVRLDTENQKAQELEKMCFIVEKVKGRHDYQ